MAAKRAKSLPRTRRRSPRGNPRSSTRPTLGASSFQRLRRLTPHPESRVLKDGIEAFQTAMRDAAALNNKSAAVRGAGSLFSTALWGALFLAALASPSPAETVVFRGGRVEKNVKVIARKPGGIIDILVNNQVVSLSSDRYILATNQDVLSLRDGRFLEGKAVSENSFEVVWESPAGRETFALSKIKEIIRADESASGGGDDEDRNWGDLPSAEAALDSENPIEALKLLRDYASDPNTNMDRAPALTKRALDMVLAQIREFIRRGILSEAQSISDEVSLVIGDLRMDRAVEGDQRAFLSYVSNFNRQHAQVYLDAADAILRREDVGRYSLAWDLFLASHKIRPSFEAYTGPAELLIRQNRIQPPNPNSPNEPHPANLLLEARRLARQDHPSNWQSRWSRAWGELNSKERQQRLPMSIDPEAERPAPTPAPEPTPGIVVTDAMLQPAPMPAPAPVAPGWQGQVQTYYRSYVAPIWNGIDDWARRQFAASGQVVLGIAAAIALFNWGLALLIINARIQRMDFLAQRWKPYVKAVGLPALALYGVKTFANRKKAPKGAKCPHCSKVVENIDLYRDYKFDECPHCRKTIDPLYTLEDYIQHLLATLQRMSAEQSAGLAPGAPAGGMTMNPAERDAMQNLIRAIVTLGIRRRASDVHIEPEVEGAKVRMRIDGVLYDMLSIPPAIMRALVSAIKVMATMDIAEKRIPQDGKISLWIDGVDVDIRVNTAPHQVGERVAMRLLDSRAIKVDSTKLGMEGRNLEMFEQIIRRPAGVVYLTGPTGSGKTTTLYVALNTINDGRKNIVTIEDPIEYQLKGINQMQVNPAQGFTFASGLRSILRGDPDVIMIGEVRDKETADIGVDAASTGHLVFTTLHTIDAASVVARLFDLGVEPRRVSASLLAAIAQRLARVNCPVCKKPYHTTPAELKQLGMKDEDIAKTTFYKGFGCEKCQGTGFQGRVGLFEMFIPDEGIREMIESGGSPSVVREMARKRGMTTLREEGIQLVMQGTTTVEEVLRAT
jgi:type II secretory ATPase GspE/PulE/Tfp pilus assembly ATPase PilB-like protein